MVYQQIATAQLNPSGWTLEDKSRLMLKLYQKALFCMDEAIELIECGEMVAKGERLIRAQDIVWQLSDALDHRGEGREIAMNLGRLYLYVYRLLIRGNNLLDTEAIREARHLMAKLLSAWEEVSHGVEKVLPAVRARY